MLDSLSSAVSGLDAFQQEMDIIGNNIANINTTGYKDARADLTTSFSDTLQAATAGNGTTSVATDPEQIGTGVTTAAIQNNWTTGTINSTGVASDLAINGNGFFLVQDPLTKNQYVTQAGDFSVNGSGNLVTDSGMYVMSTTGSPIVISPPSGSSASVTSYAINGQGQVTINLSDGTTSSTQTIGLQNFSDPQQLTAVGDNLYTYTSTAGPLSATGTPGANGLGTIQSGALELSNVDLSSEMANLITAQRAFEANSKIITTSDELLQDVVNMKH